MKWLFLPYPLLQSTKYKWFFALSSGVFVYIFLIIYEPFGTRQLTTYKYLFLTGNGASVFLGVATTYFTLPKLFREFHRPEKWTVGKEILLQSCCILIISAFIYLHNNYLARGIVSYQTFFNYLEITILIGIFPSLFHGAHTIKKKYLESTITFMSVTARIVRGDLYSENTRRKCKSIAYCNAIVRVCICTIRRELCGDISSQR